MDTPPPSAFTDDDLTSALAAHWAVRVDAVRYVPKGMGSYHWVGAVADAEVDGIPAVFVTVDDLDTKPWIARERDRTFAGLGVAYATANWLQHGAGVAAVVAPLATDDGRVVVRLDHQHSLSVFPYVDGVAGSWGSPIPITARASLLTLIAQLHDTPLDPASPLPTRPMTVPERPLLAVALDELDEPWDGGPHSEPARRAIAEHRDAVCAWLERLDALGNALTPALERDGVLTHGEPHPGNLITTDEGLRLIDWDTVAIGLRERDLWMLDDGSSDAFAIYEEATGHTVDRAAMEFHRLAWTLSDIASFTATFRGPHARTEWTAWKWDGFVQLLGGASSTPYG